MDGAAAHGLPILLGHCLVEGGAVIRLPVARHRNALAHVLHHAALIARRHALRRPTPLGQVPAVVAPGTVLLARQADVVAHRHARILLPAVRDRLHHAGVDLVIAADARRRHADVAAIKREGLHLPLSILDSSTWNTARNALPSGRA
ncbi:hypothetical protein G6F66_014405 [Rhizopus arrhizus]|nr:hypothetical protein G6F66_014405 [Rhizopus arrhizus]